jgi:peptidoglycan hydrolase FlgJ
MDISLPSSPTVGYHDFAGLARLRAQAAQDDAAPAVARQAAEQFEAHFIQQMMKSMREAVERSDWLDSAHADQFQELMDKEVAVQMAKRGSLGLADQITRGLGIQPPQPGAPAALQPPFASTAHVLATRQAAAPKEVGHE